jgi:hypothetical protein
VKVEGEAYGSYTPASDKGLIVGVGAYPGVRSAYLSLDEALRGVERAWSGVGRSKCQKTRSSGGVPGVSPRPRNQHSHHNNKSLGVTCHHLGHVYIR